ncbi:hypothetical protein GCM10027435_08850 [Haloparvum alkalitolerans]|uniref:ATPase, T2SS/T4P/T4SS family n=1 Tax=Haloparvum alkalitolerans TaxID=1042953 RepID=UPI003CF73345
MDLIDRVRTGALAVRDRVRDGDAAASRCECEASFTEPSGTAVADRTVLTVDADGCHGAGRLAERPACRRTVIAALTNRDANAVSVRCRGLERRYAGRAAAFLVAAGRFRERVRFHEDRLADRAATDPLGAATEAVGRAGAPARAVAETGLAAIAEEAAGYDDLLRPFVGPTVGTARVAARLPTGAMLRDRWETGTGATVRIYDGDGPLRTYHLTPPSAELEDDALATLADARERLLGNGHAGERAPGRAVRAVADADDPVEEIADVLCKHARGFGVLSDVFADDHVSDAFLAPPVSETPLRVVVDGERLTTNVRVPPAGAATLASRLRRASGDGFSRAAPTLDATLDTEGGPVRVAATTDPASDGLGFAFRRGGEDAWTLPGLVDAGTLTARAAGLLSVATERGVAALVAGGRGAGKTTTLGALLWELPSTERVVLVEDTPELPAASLRGADRDVQRLNTDPGAGAAPTPSEAVRTALRLGDGALVVGEVRGEEAAALYEAMRVGAGGDAVLGTIHGSSGPEVRERVVEDLGVAPSAFASTDLLVTLADHEVTEISEVCGGRDDTGAEGAGCVRFEPLFERGTDGLAPTGRIDRGESRLVAGLAASTERYADVLRRVDARTTALRTLVDEDRTRPRDVAAAVADRERACGTGSSVDTGATE